ncbi:MAG: hypothetical protein JWM68_709 [Verrucomicrobiales bacterium]|nr:hypothetical protein [Verrucomicrobiales bacterium]
MKRFFFPVFSAVFLSGFLAVAQTATPSPQELQEKVERLSGDVERLTADNLSLKNKITALSEELGKAREEMAKINSNTGVADDMRRLAEKIQEVDKKRIEDNQTIAEQIKKLGEIMRQAATVTPPTKGRTHVTEEAKPPQNASEHKIESGDTLSTIVVAYNEAFKKQGSKTITMKQVMEANPNVNWNRLQVGQKIFIPLPAAK